MLALCSNGNEVGGALLGIGPGEERMVKAEKDIKLQISDLGMLIFAFFKILRSSFSWISFAFIVVWCILNFMLSELSGPFWIALFKLQS